MTRTTRRWITWSSIVLGTGLAVWGLIVASGGSTSSSIPAADAAVDHVRGSLSAPAVLIEYGDFQCPACGQYEPIVEQVTAHFGAKMALVFREYPLVQVHQDAQIAAQGAEAASLQGKFWEFHDLLYQRQSSWPQALDAKQTMIDYAKELGLDTKKFASDIDASAVKDRITRDVDSGTAARIPGTPAFFLNGQQITNPASVNDFISVINGAINKK